MQNVTIQGSIYDIYDFAYQYSYPLVFLARPAAILEFGWNAGLNGGYFDKGAIYKDTIIINKTIDYELCFW